MICLIRHSAAHEQTQYMAFSHHWQGSIDFNTVNTTHPTGMYFLIYPLGWINDERMAVHCLESGCIGLYIPSDLGKYFCLRGYVTQYIIHPSSRQCTYTMHPDSRQRTAILSSLIHP